MQVGGAASRFNERAWVEVVVAGMRDDIGDLAAEISAAIYDNIGALDEDLSGGTLQSVRAILVRIAGALGEGIDPAPVEPPAEALAYLRSYVRRGLGFEVLQRAYRTAHARLSREIIMRLRPEIASAEELASTAGFVSDWLFAWFDALEHVLARHYTREREQWMRGTLAMSAAEVRAILEGQAVDVQAASGRLRYELNRRHVAFVVWATAPGRAEDHEGVFFRAMEEVADDIARTLGAIDLLAIPLGPYLACWAGFRRPPSLDVLPRQIATAAASGLNVAIGHPGQGLEGFRRSHEEAVRSRSVVQIVRAPAGYCATYSEVALDALMTRDRDEAERFVRAELGPLAAADARSARLRETLEAFLEANCSFRHAAQQLNVHENTVGYRVRRCEELLGHRVRQRQLELRAALRLARLAL